MESHPFGWMSLLPPIVAIVLAIITRRIVLSLVLGIFAGALVMSGGDPLTALGHTWETHLWSTLIDPGKMRMLSFTLLMGGMVGVITRSGGMQGLVKLITPYASNRRRGQLATWMLGVVVFFDDYANTMLLGSTLQPVYERLRISKEKLAYVVDSTAAPVAALAPLSTWVAIEIDSIASGLETVDTDLGAFGLFVSSIPYRFYVWMALFLVPMTVILGRDFGMMAKAERRTLAGEDLPNTEQELGEQPKPSSWLNAMLPILATLLVVVCLVYSTGAESVCSKAAEDLSAELSENEYAIDAALLQKVKDAAATGNVSDTRAAVATLTSAVDTVAPGVTADSKPFNPKLSLQDIFGAASSTLALQYGALVGLILAMLLSWGGRILSFDELISSAFSGARIVLPAVAILWCAAAMSRMTTSDSVTGDETTVAYEFKDHRLYTAEYLTPILAGPQRSAESEEVQVGGLVSVEFLPSVVFLLAAVVAFCTGTSWGTMGILLPLSVQTAFAMLNADGVAITANNPILVSSVGGVLAGAVFGDHCSPISDTTVLSSQWSGCDHLAHVWTQLPYALLAAAVSVLLGTLPIGFGVSVWILLPLQLLAMYLFVRFVGQRIETTKPAG